MQLNITVAASPINGRGGGPTHAHRIRAAAALTGLLLAAGCSQAQTQQNGHDHPPSNDQVRAYQQCMSNAGYPMGKVGPPPTADDPHSVWNDPRFTATHQQCIATSGVGDIVGDTPSEARELTRKAHDYTACLRAHGRTITGPTPEAHGRYLVPGRIIPPANPADRVAFDRDINECAHNTYGDPTDDHDH